MTQSVETNAKKPRIEVQNGLIELTISFAASGDTLAQVWMPIASSVADLKRSLQEHIEAGSIIQKLLKGDTQLQDDQSLEASGLIGRAEVKAIVGSRPILFLADITFPFYCHDGHSSPERDTLTIAQKAVQEGAPAVAREVAQAMIAAAPDLADIQIVRSSKCYRGGQVIVIGHPGDDAKKACLETLQDTTGFAGFRLEFSRLQDGDWGKHFQFGFNDEEDGLNFRDRNPYGQEKYRSRGLPLPGS